jgi:hypothetical protein
LHRCRPRTGGNRQQAETDDLRQAVRGAIGIARVGNAGGEPFGDTQPPLDLAQDKHAAIRRERAAIEAGDDVFFRDW